MYNNEKVSFDTGSTLTSNQLKSVEATTCIRQLYYFPWPNGLPFENGQNHLGLGCWGRNCENRKCARHVYLTTAAMSVWVKNANLDPHILPIWSQGKRKFEVFRKLNTSSKKVHAWASGEDRAQMVDRENLYGHRTFRQKVCWVEPARNHVASRGCQDKTKQHIHTTRQKQKRRNYSPPNFAFRELERRRGRKRVKAASPVSAG